MGNFKEKKADIELIYKSVDGLNLPIQVFLPDGDLHKARTVIAIHGGGWEIAREDNSPWDGGGLINNTRYLSEHGFIGIAVSYRSLKISEDMNVTEILRDCTDAILYIREHLKFVNFDDITYIGESAGGYIVSMLGVTQDDAIRPHRVVAVNPVLEITDDKWHYGFKNCKDLDKLLPRKNIGKKCADFLFMHGTSDTVAEIEYSEGLNDLLVQKGHKSELIKVPDAKHAFLLYDYKYPDEFVTKLMDDLIAKLA